MSFRQSFINHRRKAWQFNIQRVQEVATILNEHGPQTVAFNIPAHFTNKDITVKNVRDLNTKIVNADERTGGFITQTQILQSIINDPVAACAYAKDPLKQNFAENFQYKWLKQYGHHDLQKLSSGGKQAWYLVNGELVTNLPRKPSGSNATKSIDFQCNHKYFYAKYTNAAGGAQDNQCADGKCFIEQANIYCNQHQDDKIFILLVDGDYYDTATKDAIRAIISPANKERVCVCSSDEASL